MNKSASDSFNTIVMLVMRSRPFVVKTGVLVNEDLGVILKIQEDELTNEVKKNCLLFDFSNEIQIRKGDIIVFYISKKK